MDYRNKMFRRLSITFLVMAMISLMLFIIFMFFIAKDDAFTCPEDQYFCYISSEFPTYRSAIYGLSFSLVFMLLLSSIFSKQVEFTAEYSGYIHSISETEREKIKEDSQASSALKEYFLHLEALEREKNNKENQLSMSDITGDEFIKTDTVSTFDESELKFGVKEEVHDEIIELEEEIIKIEEDIQTTSIKENITEVEAVHTIKIFIPRKTKKDFEKIIFEETDLNKTKSKLFLKTLLDVITEEVKQGNIINLTDFGKFRKITYKSRNGINPKTKEKIIIKEHSVARFYPNKNFISILSNNIDVKKTESNTESKLSTTKNIPQELVIKKTPKLLKRQTLTKTSNKKEIILQISSKSGLSKNKSKEFLNAFIETIIIEMKAKNTVVISNFGKFRTIDRALKHGINPHTKEKLIIPAHTSVKFNFTKEFKQKLNQKK